MFVLTADQRDSTTTGDGVPSILTTYAGIPAVRGFDRTAGDEVEAVFDDPAVTARVAAELAASGEWSVGIGVDDVELPLPAEARAGRGPAFVAARTAVETAKGRRIPVRVEGASRWCRDAETALCLLVDLMEGRTEAGREAVDLVSSGLTQAQAAERLGISPQAVSLRLRSARWDLQSDTERLAASLLGLCEENRC
ncbi:MAG: hypothetical protein QM774_04395 [Gordonia sp. (in: high G+C Gram-positive bacteria)]|uniref:hypothetical protein n=1 Tax=Gordonia sp. (in: high G+C Gram-positive bacteria) TaxID=84139 RepID=UPI0039E3431F